MSDEKVVVNEDAMAATSDSSVAAKMTRAEVYALIDGEREYQATVEADSTRCRPDEFPHSLGEYYCMLMRYVNHFPEVWGTHPDGDDAITEIWRKIAGIAVHCMEDHGAPPRKPHATNPNGDEYV